MTPEEIAANKEADTAAAQEVEAKKADAEELLQKTKRSEKEKAERALFFNAEKLKELGGDPAKVLDISAEVDEVPDWYKKEQAKQVTKSALQLADGIEDANEREQVKEYLSTRIIPSGNADADFRLAFGAVRATKNKEIIEEVTRRTAPRTTAAGGSAPIKIESEFVPTPEERVMMGRPYNLSKEKILEARRKEAERQQK